MKFLCLGYYDEKKFDALSKDEVDAIVRDCRTHDEALHRSSRLVAVASLGPTRATKSVRPKQGKALVTDGPFVETKEQIGSFFIIEARDLDEATEVASLHPAAHLGENVGWGIEVRPIDHFEQTVAARSQLSMITSTVTKENAMHVQPYLFFDGRAEEAIEFYRSALGAEVQTLLRFKDGPEPHPPGMVPPGAENKIMHASFVIGDTTVMASDGRCLGKPTFQGFSLSFTVPSEAEAERLFSVLGKGGEVQMPLAKTFFSPRFGMVADRFGVSWMVHVEPREQVKK